MMMTTMIIIVITVIVIIHVNTNSAAKNYHDKYLFSEPVGVNGRFSQTVCGVIGSGDERSTTTSRVVRN